MSVDQIIERISEKLKNEKLINKDTGEIVNHVTVGAGRMQNIEAGGQEFYRFIGEFSNGKANGLCQYFNEVDRILEAYVYINGKMILALDYDSLIDYTDKNGNTKKNPRVSVIHENLNETRFRHLITQIDLADIENKVKNQI